MSRMNHKMNFPSVIAFALIAYLVAESATTSTAKDKDKTNSKAVTSEVETTTVSIEERDKSDEFNLLEVMSECNDSFRVEMSYLESFNESGSFPDETDKTPKIRDLAEEDIVKIATGCTDRPETCKCERSYQYLKCLMEMVIEKYDLER